MSCRLDRCPNLANHLGQTNRQCWAWRKDPRAPKRLQTPRLPRDSAMTPRKCLSHSNMHQQNPPDTFSPWPVPYQGRSPAMLCMNPTTPYTQDHPGRTLDGMRPGLLDTTPLTEHPASVLHPASPRVPLQGQMRTVCPSVVGTRAAMSCPGKRPLRTVPVWQHPNSPQQNGSSRSTVFARRWGIPHFGAPPGCKMCIRVTVHRLGTN
mmetsp:Transcript_30475/g.78806  ORF Transcript_30475/g.78806 Transcript_30475/m.78806 type:complete len:207 (-) Transcript_30475:2167-2787(-)